MFFYFVLVVGGGGEGWPVGYSEKRGLKKFFQILEIIYKCLIKKLIEN